MQNGENEGSPHVHYCCINVKAYVNYAFICNTWQYVKIEFDILITVQRVTLKLPKCCKGTSSQVGQRWDQKSFCISMMLAYLFGFPCAPPFSGSVLCRVAVSLCDDAPSCMLHLRHLIQTHASLGVSIMIIHLRFNVLGETMCFSTEITAVLTRGIPPACNKCLPVEAS